MPEWQEAEEAELLKQAQGGDTEAFGCLYEHHAPTVYRFLYAHLNNYLDAEDLTEEVFLRAWKSLKQYQEQGIPFVAYLFRISRNALIDHYRSNRRGQPAPLEDENLRDPSHDPAETVLSHLERSEIRSKLDQLKEEYRSVLLLRFLSGLSPEETAQALGKPVGTVRVIQHRALAALKKVLEPEQGKLQ